ncbi:hypothetical protein [Halomonas sp. BC04]|uniref:hypothetical protein n=1 Tax=Halomonas sp. BC04 TaxID=1403540 RepID=UPI0003ED7718|nr:hypothetical protein [Halomonas sp. BC04]EWH02966.1 hypothetical protein Q427_05935 [Halomonas sp. BC04]
MRLTLQIYHDHHWHDAAQLVVPEPDRGTHGPARLGYLPDDALDDLMPAVGLGTLDHRLEHWGLT